MASQFYSRYIPPAKTAKRELTEQKYEDVNDNKNELPSPKKKQRKDAFESSSQVKGDEAGLRASKHRKLNSKFERSGKLSKLAQRPKIDTQSEERSKQSLLEKPKQLYGLEPLPQPEDEEDAIKSTISVLPEWISKPVRAVADQHVAFDELDLSRSTKAALSSQGYEKAFAIQSTVLPLLLPGPKQCRGDLCIASGTGTGKTLAFALPMIEAIRGCDVRKLRGLIVVPTRELVSQTRSLFEKCSAGSGLRVASSEGSHNLAEEQKMLVETIPCLKTTEMSPFMSAFINYRGVEESADDESFDEGNLYMSSLGRKYRSKVDVLVCTPGRLIDHMKSTKGFTLDFVKWLVIDEVDKLLNQSYQEWIEYVIPALEKEQPLGPAARTLKTSMRWHQKRAVRKVIASATLTTNISKLVELRLSRPTLVVLEAKKGIIEQDSKTISVQAPEFVLPETLQENVLSVKEGSDKPLYALNILDQVLKSTKNSQPDADLQKSRNGETSTTDDNHGPSTSDSESDEINSSSDESFSSADRENDVSNSTVIEDTSTSGSAHSDTSNEESSEDDSSGEESSESDASSNSSSGTTKPEETCRIVKRRNATIIFTTSNQGAMRLTRLLKLMRPKWASQIDCLVGSNSSTSRRRALTRLRKGQLAVVVTSNLASRGLNIGNISQVINYDVPTSLENYVHRVGRTARAGNMGTATTLLAHHEARWFWNEIARSPNVHRTNKVARLPPIEVSDEERDLYQGALGQLGDEARGKL